MSKRTEAMVMCATRFAVAFVCMLFGVVAIALGLAQMNDGVPYAWKLVSGSIGLAMGLFLALDAIRRLE